jgi:prefoldin subunit 5
MARTPYAKTTWVDRDNVNNTPGTKLNAQNFNKLEQGLEECDSVVVTLEAAVAALQSATSTISTLQSQLSTLQGQYTQLKSDFDTHVHENDAGTTTGPVVIPTP